MANDSAQAAIAQAEADEAAARARRIELEIKEIARVRTSLLLTMLGNTASRIAILMPIVFWISAYWGRVIWDRHGTLRPILFTVFPLSAFAVGLILGAAFDLSTTTCLLLGTGVMVAIPALVAAVVLPITLSAAVIHRRYFETRRRTLIVQGATTHRELSEIRQQYRNRLYELRSCRHRLSELARQAGSQRRLQELSRRPWRSLRGVPFEEFLREVFEELGFKAEITSASGDQGVDLLVSAGDWRIAVQAKGYSDSVGNKAVQEVVAGRYHYQCNAWVVVTNSTFTSSAVALANSTRCVLIDGERLQRLITNRLNLIEEIEREHGGSPH